jgi:hypothetical protein
VTSVTDAASSLSWLLSAFKALLDLGAELRALSAVGWPPLFYAVENRHASYCMLPCERHQRLTRLAAQQAGPGPR